MWLPKQAQIHLESTSFFHVTVKRGKRNKGRESQEHILTNPNHKTNNLKPNHRRPKKVWYLHEKWCCNPPGWTHIPATSLNQSPVRSPRPHSWQLGEHPVRAKTTREMSRTWDCTLGPTLAHETLCYWGQMLRCSKPVKHIIVTCRKILRKHRSS